MSAVPPRGAATARPEPPLSTLTLPAIPRVALPRGIVAPRAWYQDRWHVALLTLAALVSVAATIVAFSLHLTLLDADSHTHLLIARRVVDNIRPGPVQLGGTWLPLPHLLQAPLIWNDALWRTGLAGTLVAMPCFIAGAHYVFLTARQITHDSRAAFLGSLVFVLNPNVLYLQSTPLSEAVVFAALAAAIYRFTIWAREDGIANLLAAALWTGVATLTRYDAWALFAAMLVAIPLAGALRRGAGAKVAADVVLFGLLGGLGIALWFLWEAVIFGNPLYFLAGPFSAQAQTTTFVRASADPAYHQFATAARTYGVATLEALGPVIVGLAALGLVAFVVRQRGTAGLVVAIPLLVPVIYYVVGLYLGQVILFVPHANAPPYLFANARFGVEMAGPAAVLVATLIAAWPARLAFGQALTAGLICAQTVATALGGVVTIQDGRIGATCPANHPVELYLAQHYNGGLLLLDTYHTTVDLAPTGIAFRSVIYEGDGDLWTATLRDPASAVRWVVVAPGDLITGSGLTDRAAFLATYHIVARDPAGATLFLRDDAPPLANRPAATVSNAADPRCAPVAPSATGTKPQAGAR